MSARNFKGEMEITHMVLRRADDRKNNEHEKARVQLGRVRENDGTGTGKRAAVVDGSVRMLSAESAR